MANNRVQKALTFDGLKFSDGMQLAWTITENPRIADYSMMDIDESKIFSSVTAKYKNALFSKSDIVIRFCAGTVKTKAKILGPVTVGDIIDVMKSFFSRRTRQYREFIMTHDKLDNWNSHWFKTWDDVFKFAPTLGELRGDHIYFEGLRKVKGTKNEYDIAFGS